MFEDLKDKVVLVTGSSNGIGEAIVTLFAKYGSKVVITARNAENVERVAKICQSVSPFEYEPLSVVGDMTVEEFPKELVNSVIAKFGKLDILVNNAAIHDDSRILDANILEHYDKHMAIIVRAAINLCHHALPHLIQSKGAIVNMTALKKPVFYGPCIAKISLDMLTKTMALEFGPKGVRVNAVRVGATETEAFRRGLDLDEFNHTFLPQIPLGRVAKPEEIARPVIFLASEAASYINGALLPVEGGIMLI
ncbi:3-oxoacyl-[acyl-carrier-protein] reductase FabG-like protein [Dinothrombium tinctorium]|uniref:3-oxoacyl-[acyl-carrier-protein] reductase FabG-like protein n=1 Tax=Dinothrombium tinctorium TaxID=1965070 RepID=A0A443QN93_9ACAR|nr:3-oxoacyl-[acyl-carrier-protein] reductase FabG-like protein [Dinothrombium tinctorium]